MQVAEVLEFGFASLSEADSGCAEGGRPTEIYAAAYNDHAAISNLHSVIADMNSNLPDMGVDSSPPIWAPDVFLRAQWF